MYRHLQIYNKNIINQYEVKPDKIVAMTFLEKNPTRSAINAPKIFGSLNATR